MRCNNCLDREISNELRDGWAWSLDATSGQGKTKLPARYGQGSFPLQRPLVGAHRNSIVSWMLNDRRNQQTNTGSASYPPTSSTSVSTDPPACVFSSSATATNLPDFLSSPFPLACQWHLSLFPFIRMASSQLMQQNAAASANCYLGLGCSCFVHGIGWGHDTPLTSCDDSTAILPSQIKITEQRKPWVIYPS